ncbi:uncharacterized protein LOC123675950 isoform X2 [Harmonia axyridis]|uniref:uncharacterized protein LOC123675950 isoform X2 n=1 Tax=Harmonia axyridis TaxID=115357 RepID=UPI001E27554E|nr:uncharacterized protein LOC123675950 isoform X2 [Harmonia axyridis]
MPLMGCFCEVLVVVAVELYQRTGQFKCFIVNIFRNFKFENLVLWVVLLVVEVMTVLICIQEDGRSVDSALEGRPVGGASSVPGPPQRSGTITGDPRRWLQQHQQSEEPVRQRISPIADADMTAGRAPNVSVLHLRNSTDSWENNAKLPTANSRIYPSSRKPAGVHCLTKHQSLGGIESKFRWTGKSIETSDMNSSEAFLDNQYNRELSPVRWCNREVDGVYLGRSGWVQVQHKSLDDRKISNFRTTAKVTQAQDSKRVALKLSQYHYKSEPGRCPSSPTKLLQQPQKPLYLSIKEPVKFDEIKKKSPQNNTDSFSPPPHTPIISPPPAFQDKATTKTSPKRTFFGKSHFLPRSNAIDRDVSPPVSPSKEVFKTCAPMATIIPKPRVSPKTSPSNEKQQNKKPEKKNILQAKSLEETSATRRSKFFQKHAESSSSSSASSMGFRSLDSCVSRPTMPRLSEITDSSLDVYEDADDEDNNSSSINMSITGIDQKASFEVLRNREKMLANIQNSKQNQYRNPLRRSPAGSECNKQLNCSSSSTESIDLPTRNSNAATPQNRRSPLNRYIQSRSPQEEIAQKVRRSKSLQLPERKPGSTIDRGGRRVSPQPPPGRNNDRNRIYNNITPLKPQSFEGMISEDVRREAEVVTEYIYGNRSRAAAQALMMHRLNNGVSAEEAVEARRPTAEGITVYYIGKQRNDNSRGFQRDKTLPSATNHTRISPQSRQESSSYGANICDYWTHCGNRDSSLTRDSQFVMRSSQSYPIQHHVSLDSANVRMDRVIPDNLKRRSGGVITERRVLPPQFSVRNTLTPTDFLRNGRSDQEVTDIMDRLSPSGRTTNESQERKSSPSNSRNQSNRSLDNASNSSSSDDIWLASDRTVTKCPRNAKSSGASTPLEDLPPEKEHHVREMILTRPGSAPSQDRQESFLESQQRSMSLPKSFQSTGYQQSEEFPSSNPGADSLGSSPNSRRKLLPVEVSHTAPVTPLHEGNLRRSPLRGSGDRCAKASSTPELLESTETDSRDWDKQDSKDGEIVSSRSGSKDLGRRNIPASSTESVLQKFKKSISLRFQKKSSKDSFEQGLSIAPSISKEPSEDDNATQSSSVQIEEKEEVPEHKPRFGSLIWRSSKERKRMNKAARNAKCNSGDSGIQIEMVPGCGGIGGDSSESHDTDVPADDFDSPPVVRRRPAHGRMHRPNSELFNQVLIDKFKADLKQRAHKHQRVRRSRSDLGGHRILHWDSKGSHMRNMSPLRNRPKSPQRKPPDAPEMRPPGANRRRGHLRRSLSQPLDINKLSPLMRTKTAGLRLGGQVLSEDEHDGRLGGSDDEMMSDSESSVASLNDRKKSLEMNMDEEMIVLAEAVFDHVAIEAEELAFRAGDVIEVLETTNKDWWWGSTNGKTGWFPAEFVRLRVSQEDTVEDCLAAMASGQSVTSHLRRRTSISLLSNDQVRTSVVRELVQTERDFVKALEDVAEGYIAECRKRVDMFTEEQIGTIFINLEDILRFQSAFLKDLESCVNWDAPHKSRVGDCFLRYKSGFEIYSDYCNSHPMATVLLQELYQFNNYCKFFEACRLMRGLIEIPLDGYLLTPVQRICKYPLQLAELLKYTRADHEDHDNIKEALEAMRGVAVLINERKRRMESLEKLCTWQQRVDDWEGEDLIEISSQLLYQGDVIRVKSAMWTSSITLFLFDHQIIYCKKDILKRNTYIYKGRIDLDTTEVIDIPDGKDIHIGVTVRHAIKLYSVIRDKWLLFCCRSSSDKEKWLKAFNDERRLVAQDKSEGLEFTSTAKQLARLSAKCKRRRPPHKPRASKNFKHDSAYMGSMLQLNTGTQSSHSLGRKMGNWFTFGGNKKSRHQTFETS